MKPLLALLLSFTLTGCVFDSTRHCPNGVRVAFASQTACQSVPTWPEISVMRLFAFGEDGLLVATVDDATAVLGSN
jgi:hypothetical protein